MPAMMKTLKFCNGVNCPILGLGTWRSYGNEVYEAVKQAILNGYRHIDTATYYRNEEEVGKAVNDILGETSIKRSELFVVTKLPSTCNHPSLVLPALKSSLAKLNVDYVDLYLMHTPVSKVPLDDTVASTDVKKDKDGNDMLDDVDPVDTWHAMEKCVELGFAKSIGLSNCNSLQVQSILDSCTVKPVTNQVECHPLLPQKKLRRFCQQNDILITSFRPLGGQKRKPDDPNILENDVVQQIAKRHGKLPAQILLRWHVQQDLLVLAKSSNVEHLVSNAQIFDFSLTDNDMKELDQLENGHRYCPYLDSTSSSQYPFHVEF